jgi:hypothetical protein
MYCASSSRLSRELDSVLQDLLAVGQGALAPVVAERVMSLADDGLELLVGLFWERLDEFFGERIDCLIRHRSLPLFPEGVPRWLSSPH